MRVLILRPRELLAKTIEVLREEGFEAYGCPFIELEYLDFEVPEHDFVIVTSQNIARVLVKKSVELKKIIDEKYFSDTKIPLTIIATDLKTGKEIKIKKGKLIDAVLASISIPGIFPPYKIDDKLLVDGGISNPTPIDVADEMGADIIIAVDFTLPEKIKLRSR